MEQLTALPVYASDLVKYLDQSTPARCIRPGESLEDAHRYAGKRELVDFMVNLMRRSEAASADPTKPLLGNRNVLRS